MLRRRMYLIVVLCASLGLTACGGGGDDDVDSRAGGQADMTTTTLARTPATTVTSLPAIEGVETFRVDAGHSLGPVNYPHVPPVGGIHDPVWQPCTFYAEPVPNEKAVHSLEHGAIWITYRPDLPEAEIDALANLARSRKDVLVSRWDSGLPSPVVVTGWGRQLRLQSTSDPRLLQFVRLYANQGPEINAPC